MWTIPIRRSTSGSRTASSTRSYNCLDRHVEEGNGDRVAFHWRGEEGEEEDLTYAELHRDVQKFANALKDLGIEKGDIVGIFLPMIPEVIVAMLACARIGAPHNVVFGGFSAGSVRERMEFSEAKALITVDGARRKGKTANIKQAVDEEMERARVARAHRRGQANRRRLRNEGRAGRLVPRDRRARPTMSVRPRSSTPSIRCIVLYTSGSTAKPKGVLHTTGGYLTGVSSTHRYVFDLQARRGRLLVLRRRGLGHRPLLHRVRADAERRDQRDVRGRARLPATRTSGGSCASATA